MTDHERESGFTRGDLARATGCNIETIRYYERIGLIQRPARDEGGRRDYDPAVLDWIAFLARLAATGMRQADRVRYAALRRQGDTTLAARRAMIEAHRTTIAARAATRCHRGDISPAAISTSSAPVAWTSGLRPGNHSGSIRTIRSWMAT